MFPIAPLFSLLPLGLFALQSHDQSPIEIEEGAAAPRCFAATLLASLFASDATVPQYLLVSNELGSSVAVSHDTVLLGAPDGVVLTPNILPGYMFRGVVCIFERSSEGTDWQEIKRLAASHGQNDQDFGWSAAICEDTIVVGALGDDVANFSDTGAVYVFERDQGGSNAWGEVVTLTPSDPTSFAKFGMAVSISEDTVVVGSSEGPNPGVGETGAVYVFERNQGGANAWGEVKKVTPSDGDGRDRFGSAVVVRGDTLVVGAPGHNPSALPDAGSAYVFERNAGGPGAWGEVMKLTASDAARRDAFGTSVALDGSTVVVGANLDDGAESDSGSAYLFERNPGGASPWVEVKKITASDAGKEDWFGYSVAVSGDRVVVGAHQDDNTGGGDAGAAYVFERNSGGTNAWQEVAKLAAGDADVFDRFGFSVAASDRLILVGSPLDDCECFDSTPSDWGPIPYPYDHGSGSVFGISSSVSMVLTRNEGTNPLSYSASPAVLGGSLSGTCDLSATDHSMAWFFAFDAPTLVTLGGGQSLLCLDTGSGELLSGAGIGPLPGPTATFSVPVPSDSSLCGRTLYSQAIHAFGTGPFALSNSQDIAIGSGG